MVLFNDASLHGQFPAFPPFQDSLRSLWQIRELLRANGHPLRVSRSFRTRNITSSQTLNDFLGSISRDLKNRLLVWLDREGPFWEEERKHDGGEYFESCGHVVTDTGLAEAAHIQIEDNSQVSVVSLSPSDFLLNPLSVSWLGRKDDDLMIEVRNCWNEELARLLAADTEVASQTWDELFAWSERMCPNLRFSPDIRKHVELQFIPNVANRTKVLLAALNQIVQALNNSDKESFSRLKREWMEGGEARFSPSSPSELNEFGTDLEFLDPRTQSKVLCSWHGKIQTPQYRIHFEWPMPEGAEQLFVAYIGPKITKR